MELSLSIVIFVLGAYLYLETRETARLSLRNKELLEENDELSHRLIKAYDDVAEQATKRKEANEENKKILEENAILIEEGIFTRRALDVERNKNSVN